MADGEREAVADLEEGGVGNAAGGEGVEDFRVDLGRVDSLTSNGAQDVLVIKQGEVERLIPFVKGPIIKSVSLDEQRIVADWQPDY